MEIHYSHPKGFVGRNICYAIMCEGIYYGHIVGGSAALHLPNRNSFLGIENINQLNQVINNIFYHLVRNGRYPYRNFSVMVLKRFMAQIVLDWKRKYGDNVLGFESLVEPPRTGELYRRANWTLLGMTKGYQCKRIAGDGGEKWTGKRVWFKDILRPKLVFAYKVQ